MNSNPHGAVLAGAELTCWVISTEPNKQFLPPGSEI